MTTNIFKSALLPQAEVDVRRTLSFAAFGFVYGGMVQRVIYTQARQSQIQK